MERGEKGKKERKKKGKVMMDERRRGKERRGREMGRTGSRGDGKCDQNVLHNILK